MAKILVVDDEEGLRYAFSRLLTRRGHEVFSASDYNSAMDIMNSTELDLVFLDVILSGRSGMDILQEIKSTQSNCPVVMITGYPDIKTASQAVRLGAFDYIPKPIEQETLLHVAGLALKHKEVVDENFRYRRNLEAIFKSIRDGIITVDKDFRIIEVNEAAKNICGVDCAMEDANLARAALAKICNGRCLELLEVTIREGKPTEVLRHECRHVNKTRMVVSLTAAPLVDAQQNVYGGVIVIRDETRLVDMEENIDRRYGFQQVIGKSEAMHSVYSLIEKLADVSTTVLITGESGTGKELVAEMIHAGGVRKNKQLVKVNCSALPESLLETELFGHVKGAFTGAIKDKTGRFQIADGGTIFLDEIADISPQIQQRLLRVLQEKEFERVGDPTPVKVDIRVIAATNRHLMDSVRKGEFREDLLYRIKVVEIKLPPLRSRREDIPLLVQHFVSLFNSEHSKNILDVSADVMKIFMNHEWPGNVRQLKHIIEHAFILCNHSIVTVEDLPQDFVGSFTQHKPVGELSVKDERFQIVEALEKAKWNKAKAARMLGINRTTLWRKMVAYDIK